MLSKLTELSENTRITLVGLLALFTVVLVESKPWYQAPVVDPFLSIQTQLNRIPEPPTPLVDPVSEATLHVKTVQSIRDIDPQLEVLMTQQQYGELKDRLLELAADAVSTQDSSQLIEILSLLAQVSIEQQNLDVAEVYLFEALDVMETTGEEQARGDVLLQLGRTQIKSREIARSAGYAYDALQLGRNQLLKGRYNLALHNIQSAIEHSLEINRFNSAASAFSSLAQLHKNTGNQFESEQARLEAARLFSSSGQMGPARSEIEKLRDSGIAEWRLFEVENEIDANYRFYEESINQIAIAKDYQRLYHYYSNQNNLSRAWHFRILANKALENISKRAMFHRQQGVLAILYNSNTAMARAEKYLDSASKVFVSRGLGKQGEQARDLIGDIY